MGAAVCSWASCVLCVRYIPRDYQSALKFCSGKVAVGTSCNLESVGTGECLDSNHSVYPSNQDVMSSPCQLQQPWS